MHQIEISCDELMRLGVKPEELRACIVPTKLNPHINFGPLTTLLIEKMGSWLSEQDFDLRQEIEVLTDAYKPLTFYLRQHRA